MSSIFWKTIANYNLSTWKVQVILLAMCVVLTLALYLKPTVFLKKFIKFYIGSIFLWIGIVFFYTYGSLEAKKYLTGTLFILIGVLWIADILWNKVDFSFERKQIIFSILFYILWLLYPIISMLFGKRYPSISTSIMPCPMTVFSLALLCSCPQKTNLPLLALLILWALTGFPKIFIFNVPEDLILFASGIYGIITLKNNWTLIRHKRH